MLNPLSHISQGEDLSLLIDSFPQEKSGPYSGLSSLNFHFLSDLSLTSLYFLAGFLLVLVFYPTIFWLSLVVV